MIDTQLALTEWFIEELVRKGNAIMAEVITQWDRGEHPRCHFHDFVNVRFIELWLSWVCKN